MLTAGVLQTYDKILETRGKLPRTSMGNLQPGSTPGAAPLKKDVSGGLDKASACAGRGADAGRRGERCNLQRRRSRLSTAVAIEIGPVFFQPLARALHAAADLAAQLPEPRTVIHFPQVGDLVRDHVVQHVARREDEAP